MKVCSVDGCERLSEKRGWCNMHWKRWYRNGDPLKVQRIRGDDAARIKAYITRTPNCWEWIGPLDNNGYGRIGIGRGEARRKIRAHVLMYEREIGPVPEGHHLHHLCANRACVRPSHLMPLLPADHIRVEPNNPATINRQKTHCDYGHEFTSENTYTTVDGYRQCRICIAARTKVWNLKQKGLAYAN